jgi:hypothetical protein
MGGTAGVIAIGLAAFAIAPRLMGGTAGVIAIGLAAFAIAPRLMGGTAGVIAISLAAFAIAPRLMGGTAGVIDSGRRPPARAPGPPREETYLRKISRLLAALAFFWRPGVLVLFSSRAVEALTEQHWR